MVNVSSKLVFRLQSYANSEHIYCRFQLIVNFGIACVNSLACFGCWEPG